MWQAKRTTFIVLIVWIFFEKHSNFVQHTPQMELHDKLETKFRLDENQKKALRRLKLFSVSDLLFHFPVRYSDISEVKKIAEVIPGDVATVYGKISKLKLRKSFRSKIPMAEGEVEDLSGKIKIIWFNQAYLAKMIHNGENVKLTGKVTQGKSGIYLANPEFEKMSDMPIDSHDTLLKKTIQKILDSPTLFIPKPVASLPNGFITQ